MSGWRGGGGSGSAYSFITTQKDTEAFLLPRDDLQRSAEPVAEIAPEAMNLGFCNFDTF